MPYKMKKVVKELEDRSSVLECGHIAGEWDFLHNPTKAEKIAALGRTIGNIPRKRRCYKCGIAEKTSKLENAISKASK